jgi:cytochrome c oxidase subunit 2
LHPHDRPVARVRPPVVGWRGGWPLAALLTLIGCGGEQSALAPAGAEAEQIATLFWLMLLAAAVIWFLVVGTAIYASRIRPGRHSEVFASRLVVIGGIVFPTVTLALLLAYGLALMPELRAQGDGLRIHVSGEQWWWRVAYDRGDGSEAVPSANEVRLPVGRRVEILLSSPDVIHSFWIPPLAGKVDMIPGRTNRLVVEATETGEFRGVCAEYCGTSHALMAFKVVVMEEDAFADWLGHQAAPAGDLPAGLPAAGAELFRKTGCGGCHAVRGTAAQGIIGPDLTHLANRRSLAAGILPMTAEGLRDWIARTEEVKPDSRMPSFGALPEDDLDAIVAYLEALK